MRNKLAASPHRVGRMKTRHGSLVLAIASALALSSVGAAAAQEKPGSVYGRVHDERTSEPLAVVQVYIPSLGIGTLTNLDGRFMLRNVPPRTYEGLPIDLRRQRGAALTSAVPAAWPHR